MTVKELIAALSECDENAQILLADEGGYFTDNINLKIHRWKDSSVSVILSMEDE